jgi:hypothetical protein
VNLKPPEPHVMLYEHLNYMSCYLIYFGIVPGLSLLGEGILSCKSLGQPYRQLFGGRRQMAFIDIDEYLMH